MNKSTKKLYNLKLHGHNRLHIVFNESMNSFFLLYLLLLYYIFFLRLTLFQKLNKRKKTLKSYTNNKFKKKKN